MYDRDVHAASIIVFLLLVLKEMKGKKLNIIFHYPLPLDENSKSASGIRPLRMLTAFQELGYSIDLVTGYSTERKECIAKVKEGIKRGKKYDFVYSESSTMPTALTDPHHLPLNPLLDWRFFSFCKKNDIPVGLFYRDIYWLFDNYGKGLNPIKSTVAKLAYRYDLWLYEKTLMKLYLPSVEMGKYVPISRTSMFSALPPGHNYTGIVQKGVPDFSKRPLKLFYVGGMSEHYQLHVLFKAVCNLPKIELTVCTRKAEWLAVQNEYPPLPSNISVVHLSGKAMEAELKVCDIAILFVKPQEYREFASPVKLYEYLGFQKPILASEGTLAGQFVKDNGIGWSVPYDIKGVTEKLEALISNPSLFAVVYENLLRVTPNHTWQARAQQVIKDLTK
ncbi:glycosyltransferase family 1 protein [Vibrio metschnikovii]|nr:glycosyltransferase family 1 protein [Vibrio metschnikovii]